LRLLADNTGLPQEDHVAALCVGATPCTSHTCTRSFLKKVSRSLGGAERDQQIFVSFNFLIKTGKQISGGCGQVMEFFTTLTFFFGMRRETMHTRNYLCRCGRETFLIWRYVVYMGGGAGCAAPMKKRAPSGNLQWGAALMLNK